MTTVAELVGIGPPATAGVPAGFVHTAGVWRHVVEIADPGLGSSVVWHDVTTVPGLFTGYQYGRGSDGYQGRYRASIVNLDFYASSDALAPWNPDNSATFGVHVNLGPGLLIRSGFILVDAGIVTAWNPRFTCKVESWGDASYSQGKVRIHRVTARDTMSSLVNVPIQARSAENWSTRFLALLADAGWPYGALMYGAQLTAAAAPILGLPDRPAATSAINELDAVLDPVGLVWYTNRLGQLIVRPRVEDTFHAAAFAAGATGTPWTDRDPTYFAWFASQGGAPGEYPGADHAAYAVDTPSVDSFGFDETDRWVINHVKVADPFGPGFDDDDPVSIGRYDRKSYQASWLAPNPTVAADMLTLRSYATVEARPLHTSIRLDGFHPGPAAVEYLDPVHIVHRNNDAGLEVFGDGWLRSYTEQVGPHGFDTDWSMSFLVDISTTVTRDTTGLLPVVNLHVTAVSDITASFAWTNPAQTIEPTHTQIRLINPASVWQTVGYPLTGLTWYGLEPETGYEFQVRLLRIVDGLTTHFSPLRGVTFTTDKLHDIGPGCVLEWRLERSVDGADPWFLVDSGVDDEAPFNLPDYDLGSLDPEQWYRWVSHEDCDGVEGPDKISEPFVADCMGAERLDDPPYDDSDLIAYWPEVCPNRIIREAVSDGVMIPGHALLGAAGVPGVAAPVLRSGTAGLIGYQTVSTTPLGFQDLTIGCRIYIGAQPASETRLFEYGGAWISITAEVAAPDPDAAGFTISGTVNATGHFEQTVTGSTIRSRDTEYDVLLTHNPGTGELTLYVDGVLNATHTFPIGDRIRDQMRMTLPADSWITDAAAWDKILVLTPDPTIRAVCHYDASVTASISHVAGKVTQWNDLQVGARHLVAPNIANRPNTGTRTQNGLNTVDFDGVDDYLARVTGATDLGFDLPISLPTGTATAITIAVVFKSDRTTNHEGLVNLKSRNMAAQATIQTTRRPAGIIGLGLGLGQAVTNVAHYNIQGFTNTNLTNAHVLVVTAKRSPNAFAMRYDGTLQTIGNIDGTMSLTNWLSVGNPHNARVLVGAQSTGNTDAIDFPFDGAICEIIVWNDEVLSPADCATVEAALKAKWGTP